jgi:4-hydroxybenzoate polyprenyltransferase
LGIVRKLTDLVVFSNLFVAFSVACLTLQTVILTVGEIDLRFPTFVFFATLFLYNFHRVYRLGARSENELRERRHVWIRENKLLFGSIFAASALGLAYTAYSHLHFNLFILLVPVAILSFGYSIPSVPGSKGWIRLRDIPLVKIFLITFVLSWVTVLLPFWFYGFEPTDPWSFDHRTNEGLWYAMCRRMLFIFAITIPFDIRDMEHDTYNRLRTIPGMLGVKRSIIISHLALLAFIALAAAEAIKKNTWVYPSALIASAIVAAAVIMLSRASKKEYFYTFAIEGMMVLQFALVYLAYSLGA